jgi:hypothetical protein
MGDGGKDLARQSRWVLRARTRTLFNPPSCMSIKDRFRVLGALRTPDDSPLGVESARMSSSLIPASRPPSRSGFPGNRAPTPERAADDARISASTPLPEANPTAPVAGGYGASTAGSSGELIAPNEKVPARSSQKWTGRVSEKRESSDAHDRIPVDRSRRRLGSVGLKAVFGHSSARGFFSPVTIENQTRRSDAAAPFASRDYAVPTSAFFYT